MAEQTDFNYEEAIHGVLETRTALQRGLAAMDRLEQILSEHPRAFLPLAEPAFHLRDRLVEDLGTLEARLAHPAAAPGPAHPTQQERDVPLADRVNLGAQ